MCIAVYKPIGIDVPDKDTLHNCFNRNKDGAGFAIYRNGKILIHKGFMTFDDFYSHFAEYKPSKDEPVFIHFRIATHGLVDGGNTHPFPVTNDFNTMRKTDLEYSGKVLIHNGIFHYAKETMMKYDAKELISDTMLFSHFLFEKINKVKNNNLIENLKTLGLEESIAVELVKKQKDSILDSNIEKEIACSKVAIMNEDGSVDKFGNWIEDNGIFYSNGTFRHYSNFYQGTYYNSVYSHQDDLFEKYNCFNNKMIVHYPTTNKYKSVCDFCGEYRNDCVECDGENICKDCLKDFDLGYCCICKETYEKSDMHSKHVCKPCYTQGYDEDDCIDEDDYDEDETNICLCCGQNFTKSEESANSEICQKCYQAYK